MLSFSVERAIIQRADSSQPVELGGLQEISLDFSINTKEFGATSRYPIFVAQADGKISGKMSFLRMNYWTWYTLLGATKTTGATYVGHVGNVAYGDAALPIPSTPYQIVVTPPSSGTFVLDGGVILVGADENLNIQMTRVTGTPNTGEYAEVDGTYTFAAADATKNVIIYYQYSVTSGTTLAIPNPIMGDTQPFTIIIQSVLQGQKCAIKIYNALLDKTTIPNKRAEVNQFDCDFTIFPNGNGQILEIYQEA